MEIKNLQTFIYVAELGSFTKAAAQLGYSQSTVSCQIKQLEEELQEPLFERINHTVTLTQRGRRTLVQAHEMLRLADELLAGEEKSHAVRGLVRLAMADSLGSFLLEQHFADFRQKYPQVTLKVVSGDTTEMFRLLDHNEVDLVFTLDKHIYDREYVIAGENKIRARFVTAAGHPLEERREISVRELLEEPFILTERGMSYRRIMDEQLAARSLEVNPVLELGNVDLICRLLAQGGGVSLLPEYTAEPYVRNGSLCFLDVVDFQVEVWEQLLYHRDKWVSEEMKAVIESLFPPAGSVRNGLDRFRQL